MAICSGDDQIRTVFFRHVNEVTRVRFAHVHTDVRFASHAMTLQISGDIAHTSSRQILFIRRANLENRYVRRFSEKRQSVTNRKAGLSRVLPAHDDPIRVQVVHMLGHQNGRPSHSQDRSCRIDQVILVCVASLILDHNQIGRPRFVGKKDGRYSTPQRHSTFSFGSLTIS